MKEAGELAESTAILLNVSEFKDATAASEALISTMQAFEYTADESQHVVDILNEIGNNYAVSSDGLATALKDSASALMEGGNNLEQATALVAAANKVVQDPNSVGSALRTISLRLRGTSVEILEEMGESTDGAVESISKLQAKLKALTGVDIVDVNGAYKDTYTILKEIGSVWDNLDPMDQAAALELMAGKNRANTLAAILNNMKDLEGAYNDALAAEGSAQNELDTYMDSIQGRIDQFNNAVQTMWMHFMNDDALKFVINLGTQLIKIVDTIGLIPSLLSGWAAYKIGWESIKQNVEMARRGKSTSEIWEYEKSSLFGLKLGEKQKSEQEIAAQNAASADNEKVVAAKSAAEADNAKAIAANNFISSLNAYNADATPDSAIDNATDGLNQLADAARSAAESEQQETAANVESTAAETSETAANMNAAASEQQETAKNMQAVSAENAEMVANMQSVASEEQENAANLRAVASENAENMSNNVSSASSIISSSAGGAAIGGLKGLIIGFIMGLISKLITEVAEAIGDAIKTADELVQAGEKAASNIDEISRNFKQTESDVNGVIDRFVELSKGVGELNGKNLSLSTGDYEEFLNISNQLADLFPTLSRNYDENGNAILNLGNNADTITSKLKSLLDVQRQIANQDIIKNLPDLYAGTYTKTKKMTNELDTLKAQTDALKKDSEGIDDFLNNISQGHLVVSGDDMHALDANNSFYKDLLKKYGYSLEYLSTDYEYNENGMEVPIKYYYNIISDENNSQITGLDEAELNKLKEKIAEEFNNVSLEIPLKETQIKTEWGNLRSTIFSWLQTESSYSVLSDELQSAVQSLITNIDFNALNFSKWEDIAFHITDTIIPIIQSASPDIQQAITSMFNIQNGQDSDGGILSVAEYQKKIKEFKTKIEQSDYTDEQKNTILSLFGLDDNDSMDNDIDDAIEHVKNLLKNKFDKKVSGMSTQDVLIATQITADVDSLTFDELEQKIQEIKDKTGMNVVSIDTYSSLAESITSMNEIFSQTSEVIMDDIHVTQEYKDSLSDLGISTEALNECFYENNPLVVKNASLLKKLVNQSKTAKKATVEVAKAQSQLEYKELVSQIRDSISAMGKEYRAYGLITDATSNNISIMREQLQALKQTIQQYSLLEISLSDAANAYQEYEKAKERDAELTYDDSFIEMLQTIDQGILNNETGTEAFEYAVKAIVPEEFWKDIDNVDEKIRSIHDYLDGDETFAKLFTVDEESGNLDITADNVREFINLSKEAGLIIGDSTDFSLSKNVEGVEDFAKALGITEAATLALLSATEKVDAKWGNILTDVTTKPLEREVNYSVSAVDKATLAIEDFWKKAAATGQFDNQEYQKLLNELDAANKKLQENEQSANENARNWHLCQAALSSYRGELKLSADESQSLARALGFIDEKGRTTVYINSDGSLQLTDQQVTELLGKVKQLEEPSVMRVQLRYDEISEEIKKLQTYIDEGCVGTITIDGVVIANHVDAQKKIDELTPEKKEIECTYKITETSAEQDKSVLESYQELAKNGVEFTVTAKVDDAKEKLGEVSGAQDDIKENQGIKISAEAATAEKAIKGVANQLDRIKSKTITVTVDVKKTESDNSTIDKNVLKNPTRGGARGATQALGNALATGNAGLKTSENDVVVGELGPELVCDPIRHKYYTVGENGTEMVNLPRGAIVYNHKQTAELLKNGYTSRGHYTGGLSFASGSAYADHGIPSYHPNKEDSTSLKDGLEVNESWDDAISSISDANDAANDFAETFDWIEVRLEEINEQLDLMDAQLENASNFASKNSIIDQIMGVNKTKMDNLMAGIKKYSEYAAKLLADVPAQYREAAQDGAIAISEFVGEADEKTLEAINNYRDWAQKVANLKQELEGVITTLRELAIQKIDNAEHSGAVRADIEDLQTQKLQNAVDYDELKGLIANPEHYGAMMENSERTISYLTSARNRMQAAFDEAVRSGTIEYGSDTWYEELAKLYDIDADIDKAVASLEEYQNAINDIYWDNFDETISRLGYVSNETQNLIELMEGFDLFTKPDDDNGWGADDVKWTNEGITALGLHAQEMQRAEEEAKLYGIAIDDLNKAYAAGLYSENEYLEKLDELQGKQSDAIKRSKDEKDAIVELHKQRVEAIKEGIELQIEKYSELIDAQKKELESEKD